MKMLSLKKCLRIIAHTVSMIFTVPAAANIVGTPTQNFNTTANAHDYITVHSSKTIGQGGFHLGLFINNGVNTLPYFEDTGSQRSGYEDSLTAMEASLGYGVLDNLDIGLNLPAVLFQDISDEDRSHGEFARQGLTEVRLSSKVRLTNNDLFGIAAIVSTNLNVTEESPYTGENPGPTINAELAGDINLNPVELAGNIGYRWRNPGSESEDSPVDPLSNQFISSAAVAVQLESLSSKWITEIITGAPAAQINDDSGRHTTVAEALSGFKTFYTDTIYLHYGAGTELRHSMSSPDWRLYGGISYILGPSVPTSIAEEEPSEPVIEDEDISSFAIDTDMPFEEEEPDEIIVVDDIHFHLNSITFIDPVVAEDQIAILVKSLNSEEGFTNLVIEGHTCDIGKSAYNNKLSYARAAQIKEVLVSKHGIPAEKITVKGYGETRRITTETDEDSRRRNRRVEFKIYRS